MLVHTLKPVAAEHGNAVHASRTDTMSGTNHEMPFFGISLDTAEHNHALFNVIRSSTHPPWVSCCAVELQAATPKCTTPL